MKCFNVVTKVIRSRTYKSPTYRGIFFDFFLYYISHLFSSTSGKSKRYPDMSGDQVRHQHAYSLNV